MYIGCTVCAPGTYAELENATACTPCPPGTSLGAERARRAPLRASRAASARSRPSPVWTRVSPAPRGRSPRPRARRRARRAPLVCSTTSSGRSTPQGARRVPRDRSATSPVPGTARRAFLAVPSARRSASPACEPCPAGTFLAQRNATDLSQCEPCAAGTFAAETGTGECSPCPPGTFVDTLGAETCTLCPPARPTRISAGTQRTRARRAPSGPWRRTRACRIAFRARRARTWKRLGRRRACRALSARTCRSRARAGVEAARARDVAVGHLRGDPEGGIRGARPAPWAIFSDQTGAERCTPTPKGTYLPVVGANSSGASLPCPKGTFAAVEGMAECLD